MSISDRNPPDKIKNTKLICCIFVVALVVVISIFVVTLYVCDNYLLFQHLPFRTNSLWLMDVTMSALHWPAPEAHKYILDYILLTIFALCYVCQIAVDTTSCSVFSLHKFFKHVQHQIWNSLWHLTWYFAQSECDGIKKRSEIWNCWFEELIIWLPT